MLTPQASFMLQRAPLLAIGTLDDASRPWTALWGGAPGFSEPIGGGFVGTRTLVDSKYDPVVQALVGGTKGEMMQPKDGGKMISGLAIDLVTRKRVKIAGKMAAGTVVQVNIEDNENVPSQVDGLETQHQVQLVTKIEQSLGNCPKYLNQYELTPALVTSKLIAEGTGLSAEGRSLIDKADMFFLSTSSSTDMDTNHRGGPPGFVRVISPTCIIYPEYSGNRLYQSLGNLQLNPLISLTFPDYETGDVLYTTGSAEILIGHSAASLMPGTNLAVKITLSSTRFVAQGLAFRGERKINGTSPYNPLLRALASEGNIRSSLLPTTTPKTARLVQKSLITPSIARFTFSVPEGIEHTPGQWIALSFKDELDIGYEHMREDDPRSLNDDFVRTFTISSAPRGKDQEFEITIRKIGPVTRFLFLQNERAGFEVPILGVGGEFKIEQGEGQFTPFIAGGVGVTPVLGQLGQLDLRSGRFKLLWAVKGADVEFAIQTLQRYPELAEATEVYVTGSGEEVEKLTALGARVRRRRLTKSDLDAVQADTWYLCAGKPFRKQVLDWLPGKKVVFEDFDY
ncbi:hypothetical protein N0V94_005696 [Neodidymelliopsis sp. IMI 364377]|nr:hypothetical protein N0V94_005696 [Neodidymelliopsis sp. IMI 364377]